MKNLLIYVNPQGFDSESEKLTKLQIDNSLELGWLPKDILLVTSFPYEYKGIKATEVNKGYCDFDKEASKITTIVHLFDLNFFKEDLYWCHDLDAFQLEPINESELGLEHFDAGFNDYCRNPKWQLGSFFFKKSAEDIFRQIAHRIKPILDSRGKQIKLGVPLDEVAMLEITNNNINNINDRIKRLNTTYDFGMRRINLCYEKAIKPLKVLHFNPRSNMLNTLAIAMYGKNSIGQPLMNARLIKIFKYYGYT